MRRSWCSCFHIMLSNIVIHSRAENQHSLDKAPVCTPPQVLRAFLFYFFFSNKNEMKLKLFFPHYVVQHYSYHLNSATFSPHILEKVRILSMNHEFLNNSPASPSDSAIKSICLRAQWVTPVHHPTLLTRERTADQDIVYKIYPRMHSPIIKK